MTPEAHATLATEFLRQLPTVGLTLPVDEYRRLSSDAAAVVNTLVKLRNAVIAKLHALKLPGGAICTAPSMAPSRALMELAGIEHRAGVKSSIILLGASRRPGISAQAAATLEHGSKLLRGGLEQREVFASLLAIEAMTVLVSKIVAAPPPVEGSIDEWLLADTSQVPAMPRLEA